MRRGIQLLGLSFAVLGGANGSPPIKVSLRSSWPAPPPFLEILETITLESPDAFFPLLDKLTDPEVLNAPHALSPEAAHQAVMEIAASNGHLTEPGAIAAVELNLALHAATPKIEAFYSHYLDHQNDRKGNECGSWVEWYGKVVCDIEELVKLAGIETIDPSVKTSTSDPFPRPQLLTFDHIYPSPARALTRPPRTAIFYASPSSSNFRELHNHLLSLADATNPLVEYVFRHIPPKARENQLRNYLSGYGVALNLKKTDYLAIDDRNTRKGTSKGDVQQSNDYESVDDPILALIHEHPENPIHESAATPLTEEELESIGPQAIQLIADSSEPLVTLARLSQNFPKYATTLARRVVVNASIDTEIQGNSLKAQGGAHMLWLNGAVVPDKDINPFGLLRHLKKERAAMVSLTSLGISRAEAFELLTHPSIAGANSGGDILDGLFDASDRPEGGGVVVYWNDMEEDTRYNRWNPSLSSLLRPAYHGFPSVKLNLFNIILVLDLSQITSLNFIAGHMANIINRDLPLRFGLVPIVETEDACPHPLTSLGINQIATAQPPEKLSVDWDIIRRLFSDFAQVEGSETHVVADLDDIVAGRVTPSTPLEKAQTYAERLGATLSAAPLGHAFFNGKQFDFDDEFLRHVQTELNRQMQYLQKQVYEGKLSDEHNEIMSTYFYDQPSTGLRRNPYVYPAKTPGSLRIFNLPDLFSRTGFLVEPSSYLYPSGPQILPLSLYVIADLDSQSGLQLVKEALLSITPDSRARISFIHNPVDTPTEAKSRPLASWLILHLIKSHLLSKTTPDQLLRVLGFEVPTESTQTVLSQDERVQALTGGVKVAEFDAKRYADYVTASRLLARDIQISPGQQALLVNGRVVGPIKAGDFRAADYSALEGYELRKRAESIINALEEIAPSSSEVDRWVLNKSAMMNVLNCDRATYSHLISMASSVVEAVQLPDPSEFTLFQAPQRPRQRQYELLDSEYTAFEAGDKSTALYHIAVILDPLSVSGQKWSSLLQWLSNVPDTFIKIHLHPARHKEMPLKSFYRYSLSPSLSFDENGQEIPAQTVLEDLPIEPIYTLAMDVPSSWLVRPREALHDLDNLQLANLGEPSIDAVFDLDYLVVEGHAREAKTNNPPRGVQLELLRGGKDALPVDDTQVVANLGYIQFKAKPGVFGLEIRKGRGRDIFKMESVGNEGWDSPTVDQRGNEITVTSFEGLTLYPRLARNAGWEKADVLEEPKTDSNLGSIFGDITSRVTSIFKSKDALPVPQVEEQAEINIFTVASGLLYERFASIMILSVLRNTKSTVKFWFIENFLSPSFLEFIPHMAEKYNFKYELVTYKWPSWLREQTEKQRIIWAYKILFLDVLFPMDLKKVIFVDADQIVRADLKELVDLDLHGAPYGYTPMGDDNTDMEGFRFWKTGYWKDFLKGRPYHISALYVVDLVKFRQLAAGDILRGQYQQLSADPNSLANLDQDLPNNLQREVPIYSLHEDWLWCETWCRKDRLSRAKTIDLCQNPLTKEPKLARARQIPEWEEYDAEIARFARQLADEGLVHLGTAAADVNVLANAGSGDAVVVENEVENESNDNEGSTTPQHDEL
ncbi:hypothetical protein DXG03_005668 [Asterophora parasitica]|uniref:Glycosyltransferase family 24 protein n=1 Tax=Asterophora parasitica TaxID=117018 RepID=A0A9P7FZP4_9AGAR|nr:hypothetical protein DXG03_005668 [Asterophora parasitica]